MHIIDWFRNIYKCKCNVYEKIINKELYKLRYTNNIEIHKEQLYNDRVKEDRVKEDRVKEDRNSLKDIAKYLNYANDSYIYENIPSDSVKIIKSGTKNKKYAPLYFIKTDENEIIISIKGTTSLKDISVNINFLNFCNHKPLYHDSVMQSAIKILFEDKVYFDYIKNYNHHGKKIRITGHSLGAIIGVYMILILKLLCLINETYDIYVYAYGCPNLLPFYCSELITNSILCVSNGYDIICDLPLSSSFILPDNILHIDNLKYNRIVKWDSLKELYKQNKLNFEDHKIDNYINSLKDY